MKILVIGGNGFIGQKVSKTLSENGHKVTIFDKKKSKIVLKKIRYSIGDVRNIKLLKKIIKDQDIVFNFAALSDIDIAKSRPSETIIMNILAVSNILKICVSQKIKRFIQASSIYSLSEEGGFYARSKRAAEDYIVEFKKSYNINYTILRFGSLYGLGADKNNGINKILLYAKKNKKIVYRGSKKATRRYINVDDAAKLCLKILSKNYENKIINITGKKIIKIRDIINFVSRKFLIKKKDILYKNEKNTGHYIKQPTTLKQRPYKNLYIKNEKNIFYELNNLINGRK